MSMRKCYICGRDPALGFASIYQDGKERWFCHGDDTPWSCYQTGNAELAAAVHEAAVKARMLRGSPGKELE